MTPRRRQAPARLDRAPFVLRAHGQKYRAGLVTDGPVPVFVSTGVGTIVAPLRFFARPEVVLLTLRTE